MLRMRVGFFSLVLGLGPGIVAAQNLIQLENQKPGTDAWKITNPANNHEIEGYASATSVNRGETVLFYVNTAEPSFSLSVYRVGWYNGAGGRLVADSGLLTGRAQPACPQEPGTGMIECNWAASYSLTVPASPTDWTSGVYLVRLTTRASGKQSYIIFVVRDDGRPSRYLFQSSVMTFQAYNGWGGRSLYGYNSTPSPARKVSFNRPYADGYGTGDFYKQWEVNMLRFLEREGYDVSYCTDIDTHRDANLILQHAAFLVVGHDEYWTWQMRNNVEAARAAGIGLGFFSPNVSYWQVRFENSAVTGAPNRTMVGYKDFAPAEDPYYNDPVNQYLSTVRFRDKLLNRPESTLVGIMYDDYDNLAIDADMIIADASNWVCAGTGLVNGSVIRGMVGYEGDHVWPSSPANVQVIAHSPVRNVGFADVATYTLGNSTVFATGSMQWSWGLDDTDYYAHGRLSAPIQQMTRNVLARLGGTSIPAPANLIAAFGSPGSLNTNYADWVGMQVDIGATAQGVLEVGFWCQGVDFSTHQVKVTTNAPGHPDLFAPVSIRCDGVTGFHYAAAPAATVLSANTTYYLLVKGAPFYNSMPVLASAIGSIPRAVSVAGSTYYLESTTNRSYGPLDVKVSATLPTSPPVANFVAGIGDLGSVNGTYGDYAGMQVQVGGTPLTLTQLGFWCQAGDQSTHLLKVTSSGPGHPDVLAPLSLKCDSNTGFRYADAPGGIQLAANTLYYVLVKGIPFYNRSSVFPTQLAAIPGAVSVSGSLYFPESTPNTSYGPVDLKVSTSPPPAPKTLVSSVEDLGSINTTYGDYAGMQIQMSSTQTLAQVGLWCQQGDTSTHLLKLTTDEPNHPELFAALPVTCTGTAGFQYADAPQSVVLVGGSSYYVLVKGTPFYDRSAIIPTPVAGILRAVSVSLTTYYPESTPNVSYGPLDLRFR